MIKKFFNFIRTFFLRLFGKIRKIDEKSEAGKAIGKHVAQLLKEGNYGVVEGVFNEHKRESSCEPTKVKIII